MSWLDSSTDTPNRQIEPERLVRLGVGAVAVPMWAAFFTAAGAGISWWWMTSWARRDGARAAAPGGADPSAAPGTASGDVEPRSFAGAQGVNDLNEPDLSAREPESMAHQPLPEPEPEPAPESDAVTGALDTRPEQHLEYQPQTMDAADDGEASHDEATAVPDEKTDVAPTPAPVVAAVADATPSNRAESRDEPPGAVSPRPRGKRAQPKTRA